MELETFQQNLVGLVRNEGLEISTISSEELAHLFVDAAFLVTAMQFIQEQHWIYQKEQLQTEQFNLFVKKAIHFELAPISFLEPDLTASTINDIAKIKNRAVNMMGQIFQSVQGLSYPKNQIFARETLVQVSKLVHFEQQLKSVLKDQNKNLGYSLERTFDDLDLIFNLNYQVDQDLDPKNYGSERIFESSGIGVQSSYTTLLLAIEHLKLAPGSTLVDLGAGFGRLAMTVGLLRPDVRFIGFEIVSERVVAVNESLEHFGLNQQAQMIAQNLASSDFKMPAADVYYMFDPFSESTYANVLNQLVEIAKFKEIRIVTKGSARTMMQKLVDRRLFEVTFISDARDFYVFTSN